GPPTAGAAHDDSHRVAPKLQVGDPGECRRLSPLAGSTRSGMLTLRSKFPSSGGRLQNKGKKSGGNYW
ncbi:MAG: hypothetical protein OXD29_08305, partial [Roseovarius sp.]|nr:hypothetical protein [Roseovarius sp.]